MPPLGVFAVGDDFARANSDARGEAATTCRGPGIAGEKVEKAEQQVEKLEAQVRAANDDRLKIVNAIKSVQVYVKEAGQANNAVQASVSSSYPVNWLLQGGETFEPVFVPEGEAKRKDEKSSRLSLQRSDNGSNVVLRQGEPLRMQIGAALARALVVARASP
jgi:hypothetical protein